MKYIRTKDGVYKVLKSFTGGISGVWYWLENKELPINQKEIVKDSNTIEELCDWFVLRKDGKIYQIYTKEEYAVADLGQYALAFEWYYAIDTDKGLIYVAKMNDKGILCLI